MKKILILFIFLFPNFSFGEVPTKDMTHKWSCNSPNSNNTVCYLSTEKDKELTEMVGAIVKVKFTGETSNNLPNGKGKLIYNYIRVNNSYQILLDRGYATDTKEGTFKTSNDHKTILISGIKKLPDGTEIYIKNEETYKIKYSTGVTYEGKFFKDDELYQPQILEGTAYYSTGEVKKFEGTFKLHKFDKSGVTHFKKGKYFLTNGDTFEGNWLSEGNLNFRTNGTYIFKSGEKFIGSFYKSGLYKEGTAYYTNGDKFTGTFFDNLNKSEKRKGGYYYYNTGQVGKYSNGKITKQKVAQSTDKKKYNLSTQKSKKQRTKSYRSSEDGFMKSFLLSWVFTGFLWALIIFYFKVLGSIGKITKKINKKIPGTQDVAFFTGGAVTWYLAWSLLVGFEPALLINFVFIYLAIWGSATVFILNIITKSMKGKVEIYVSLFLGACSLGLAVEMIGPFIKFLKSF